MKIVFAGTPEIAATVLKRLLETKHNVAAIYTQPDRPSGRGRQLQPSPVKMLALEHHIPVEQPVSLKKDLEAQAQLARYHPDLMVVVAYGLMLPQVVLATPNLGCWNVHVSLLPRWRGAAPIQRAIQAGDIETGVTIMQMDAGLDTGDILYQQRCSILPNETAGELHDKLALLGADALLHTLQLQQHGQLRPMPQSGHGITYAHKLAKEEGFINWQCSATDIVNQVRAFNPWPIAYTEMKGQVLRIWQAAVLAEDHHATPGTLLRATTQGVDIAAGKGVVRLLSVQMPGKTVQSMNVFLNGYRNLFL